MTTAPISAQPGDPEDPIELAIPAPLTGQRLDRALATLAADAGHGLSRSRIAQIVADGGLSGPDGAVVTDIRRKVKAGERYRLTVPPAAPARPEAEAIPLSVLYEDADLIVVDKPAGMVVHPAPGAETGTLVNALLAHCGDSLTGIGAERRPGIVHRIDKETSGVLVVAKTQTAHTALSEAFATHDVERAYLALASGGIVARDLPWQRLEGLARERDTIRIETQIGRHPADRKRMAAVKAGGKRAVTRFTAIERFATTSGHEVATLIECRLETGRTHQIRVHAKYIGHSLIGDPVYGGRRALPARLDPALADAIRSFPRQALHAARLGFLHPVSGKPLEFETPLPQDMRILVEILRRKAEIIR